MYGTSLIILLFTLLSCQNKGVESDFYYETNRRWIAGTKVSWVSEHYQEDTAIVKPAGTWQVIMKVNFLDQNFNEVSDCVFYQVPSDENEGTLKVIANRSNVPCQNIIGEEEYASIDGIINFGYERKFNLNEKINLVLKIDTHRLKYNFLNYGKDEQQVELLSSSVKKTKNTGILISSDINYKVRYLNHADGKICFDVNHDCSVTIENTCHRCKLGFYKTVSSACKSHYREVCGQDLCGTKGNPACLRGYLASGIESRNYCITDSPVGICQKGLRVVCINGTLLCE